VAQQPADERLQFPAVHHSVEHPVVSQKLGGLEPFRQVLA
jgi:hypothetical protein